MFRFFNTKIPKLMHLLLSSLLLTSCANKTQNGALIGAISGAALMSGASGAKGGDALLAAGFGAIAGGLVGGAIGAALDERDKALMHKTSQESFEYSPSGKTTRWRNPDSGNSGYIIPQRAYKNGSGSYCREYTQRIMVGGKEMIGYGIACRQEDGQWRIVSSELN